MPGVKKLSGRWGWGSESDLGPRGPSKKGALVGFKGAY